MKTIYSLLVTTHLLVTLLVSCHQTSTRPQRAGPRRYGVSSFCHSHPSPSVDAGVLKAALQNDFLEAGQKIQAALDQEKSPGGMAVGLVYRDQLLWSKGFGLIDMKNPSKGTPTENTGFRIGSITKVLTALMTLILRDEGSLQSLDADVTEYLPEFSIKNPFKTGRGVTFRQLMSHMSGLPRATPCEDLFVTGCTLSDEEIYKNLAEIELLFPPGDQPLYSNLGFGLLGRSLEKMTKSKWEESVQEMVIKPLGMTNSGNTFTDKDVAKLALGYYKSGTQAGFVDMGWDAPAGQTYSTVHDLSKLLMQVFSDDKPVDKSIGQILDGETVREWLEPAYVYTDTTGFSYPWEFLSLGNYTLRTKDGRINGYMSQIEMATEIKTGLIVLQSCDDCLSHYDAIGIMEEVILQAEQQLIRLQPPPNAPKNINEYTGSYSAVVDGIKDTLNINLTTLHGGPILTTMQGGLQAYLHWDHDDSFQVSLQGYTHSYNCYTLHGGHIGQRMYFQRRGDSSVVSLTLPGTVYGKVYKKNT